MPQNIGYAREHDTPAEIKVRWSFEYQLKKANIFRVVLLGPGLLDILLQIVLRIQTTFNYTSIHLCETVHQCHNYMNYTLYIWPPNYCIWISLASTWSEQAMAAAG